jgi:hypothetical protein
MGSRVQSADPRGASQEPRYSSTIYHFADVLSEDAFAGFGVGALQAFRNTHGRIEDTVMCSYCQASVNGWSAVEVRPPERSVLWAERETNDIQLVLCPSCGWFRYTVHKWLSGDQSPQVIDVVATLRKGLTDTAPSMELHRYLDKKWNARKDLSAGRAEELVAAVFKEYLDCEVIYTSNGVYAPDGGIDFVLVNSDRGIEYAFQVKRRLVNTPECIRHVREFIGAVATSKYRHAYYVTTADRFTGAATAAVSSGDSHLRTHDIELQLVDGCALRSLLRKKSVVPATIKALRSWFGQDSVWNGNMTIEDVISLSFKAVRSAQNLQGKGASGADGTS